MARVGANERSPELLTVSEAAALCRLSKTTVYQIIRRGEWPVKRIGRTIRIPRRWLEDWIDQGIEAWEEARIGR